MRGFSPLRRMRCAVLITSALSIWSAPALAQSSASGGQDAGGVTTDEIVVTGSRIAQSGANMPTPVTIIGQDLIAQTGASQLSEVIANLPEVRTDVSATTAFVAGGGNGPGNNLVNLRGLGAVRTLVLVDGLRYPATTFTESFNTDLIPSSLVSRMDVVTGGASAAYGSDAVAGVVNIILDHKLDGIRGSAQYGGTDEGGGQDQKYSFAVGHGFMDDRIHVVAGIDYEKRKAVGNCYSRAWCAREYGIVSNPDQATNGEPALIISPNVRASQITPAGVIVSSKIVNAYGGQQLTADGTGLLPFEHGDYFAPNNNQMVGGSTAGINSFANAFDLMSPQTRWSTFLHGEADLSDSIEAWVDASIAHTDTTGSFAQLRAGNQNAAGTARAGSVNTGAITLSINNPYLPAELVQEMTALNMTTVNVGKSGDGLRRPTIDYVNNVYRVAGGLKGKLGGWKWDASVLHGQTKLTTIAHNDLIQANFKNAVQAVNGTGANAGQIVCAINQATTVDPDCAPLNIFGVGTASDAALNYIYGTASQYATIKLDDATANIQGSPFSTWAGPVSIAVGVEYRKESIASDVDDISAAGGFVQNLGALHGKNRVFEVYGETTVPLLSDVPFAKTLELNGAVRHASYKMSSDMAPLSDGTVGPARSSFQATTWKAGFVYQPLDWLRFRGTISRDFRAPNLNELFILPTVGNSAILDPQTGTNTQVPTQGGGNPNLAPEIAHTKTAGFSIQPSGALRNLQLSVDYYSIKVDGYIAAVGGPTLVTQCFQGVQDACQYVTRDSSGALTYIRNISANANQLQVAGVDVELGYRHDVGKLGSLDLRLLTTFYTKLTYVNGGSPVSGKCQNGTVTQQAYPSMPCYEITGRATFKSGPFLGGLQVRYIPKGKYGNTYIGPQDAGYDPSLPNSVSNNRVPAITYVDVNASYNLYKRDNASLDIFGVVNNLFDTWPPVAPSNNIGTNANIYDVIGRRFKVGIRFSY